MSRFDRGADLPVGNQAATQLPEFPWDPSIASEEEVERLRAAIFVQRVDGMSEYLEDYFVRSMLRLRSIGEGNMAKLAFAWTFLEKNLKPLIEVQFRHDSDRENWAAVRVRALTQIFGLSLGDPIWGVIDSIGVPAWNDVVRADPKPGDISHPV
jgi:hypothetical protein